MKRLSTIGVAGLVILFCASCAVKTRTRSSALDFLYPGGAQASPAADVVLDLPVRVGLAFAPGEVGGISVPESEKQDLLERIAAAFRERSVIQTVEVVPSGFLSAGGGFDNVDRVKAALGVDLIALLSFDQFQFSESTARSWTYWTLVGAYAIKGEKNETRTLMSAVVYDIPSRAMLLHATGESVVEGRTTAVGMQRGLRERSSEGFSRATEELIASLDTALGEFQEQASSGTVRGPGTPALEVRGTGGTGGAGAVGAAELLIALAAGLTALGALRRQRPGG